jgi:multiple sugar transport system ATP-binding protein
MISRVSSRSVAKSGDRVEIAIDTNHIHFFDKETEKIIIH